MQGTRDGDLNQSSGSMAFWAGGPCGQRSQVAVQSLRTSGWAIVRSQLQLIHLSVLPHMPDMKYCTTNKTVLSAESQKATWTGFWNIPHWIIISIISFLLYCAICGMLVSQPGIWACAPCLGGLNHWTCRKSNFSFFNDGSQGFPRKTERLPTPSGTPGSDSTACVVFLVGLKHGAEMDCEFSTLLLIVQCEE